jgi:phosphate transport system substrate-binding protein
MKILKLFLITFLLFESSAFSQKINLKIKGSDTCLPVIQKESEEYMKKNPNAGITVIGGGSGVGISALISGTTDIAMSSRILKMDEKLKLQDAGKAYTEKVFARDAISIVVNPDNKVSQLTREQLEAIFTGKIKNWQEVGGDNLPIVLYSRESSSGTYEFFKEHVMKLKNYSPNCLLMPATGAIIQSVSQTKGAIGYVGLAYVEKSVKALKVSYDGGKNYVAPSVETAKNGTYPITRPLQLYYLKNMESSVKDYVNYILSAEGQGIVLNVGYIPLK